MKLLVVSYKQCWLTDSAERRFATDGGFPFQMSALSELFDETRLCLPFGPRELASGETPLTGHNLRVVPLPSPSGTGALRKLGFPFWLIRSATTLFREMWTADAVHAPIPGDIGTVGMLLAFLMRKPLFVRHCGNWFVQRTPAEHFWKWFMERFAGGRNVMLATGGAAEQPSLRNPHLRWIFATSLTDKELRAGAHYDRRMPDQNVRLIIICRQEREKGTDVVIRSLPRILERFPTASLDVVGDGAALRGFKQLAESLSLSDRVTFHGKVDHDAVVNHLRQADVFCFPTTSSEGFPKAVLEALAQGVPVVTTRVSVLPRLIGQGGGMLLEEPTPSEVANAVIEILSNPDRYADMRRKAVDTAQQYSLERWRDTIGDLLHTAWGRPLRSDV